MKKVVSSLVVASSILIASTPLSTPFVASKVEAAQQKIAKYTVSVDGKDVALNSVVSGKATLVAAKGLASTFGLKHSYDAKKKEVQFVKGNAKVHLTVGKTAAKVNGKATKVSAAPTLVGKDVYVPVTDVAKAFGGDVLVEGKTLFVATKGLPAGLTDAKFVTNDVIIATKEDKTVLVNVKTRTIVKEFGTVDVVASHDGSKLAYVDEDGLVHIVEVATGTDKTLGDNTDVKLELSWSIDDKKLFFLQGDKAIDISAIDVTTGAVTKAFSDKAENKSNLRFNADQTYALFIDAADKKPTEANGEVTALDTTGAEDQVFVAPLSVSGRASLALTKSKDNKVEPVFVALNKVAYISPSDDDKVEEAKLVIINADTGAVVETLDKLLVKSIAYKAENVLVAKFVEAGQTVFKQYDLQTKAWTTLYTVKAEVESYDVAPNGALLINIVGEEGEKSVVVNNGQIKTLTK